MVEGNVFYEVALILGMATLFGVIGQRLRQPLIIMFLAAGIAAGPSALSIISSYDQIELLAHIGISLLLFIVGLKLDLGLIRTMGPVAMATGLGQIIFTSIFGFAIALALSYSFISSVYIAVTLTFSSTIIIVKLLSDKKEIDSLHGQIALGFLIVQDIAAILALVGLTFFRAGPEGEQSMALTLLWITLKGLGFVGVVGLLMWRVLPWLTQRLAYSQEILTLFSISWTVILSMVSDYLGFSKEVGAFLAGVSLASTEYRDAIGGRLASLRDFLLLFFFIDLGARLDWTAVGSQIGPAIIFSLFVLIGNPLIVLVIMGVMGYRRRTSFLAGLTVAQISEFSLIVAALGFSLGHITAPVVGLITLVGVVTILASTYMILYSGPLYQLLSKPLKIFEKKNPQREAAECCLYDAAETDAILVGLGSYGGALAEHLLRRRKRIIAVDFDPAVLKKWRQQGVSVLYGDIGDPEIHEQLPLDKTRWIVSTVRIRELNLSLLQMLKNRGYQGNLALTAAAPQDATAYERAGVPVIFRPYLDLGEQAADTLTHAMDVLQGMADWKIQFREVRLPSGSIYSGQYVQDIPLRSQTGVSILAVTRAGRHYYDPEPNFRIYPGDRLILTGALDDLLEAERLLRETDIHAETEAGDNIRLEEVKLGAASVVTGRTLGETAFRKRYGISVIGILREEKLLKAPGPDERLHAGDRLLVLGDADSITAFRAHS